MVPAFLVRTMLTLRRPMAVDIRTFLTMPTWHTRSGPMAVGLPTNACTFAHNGGAAASRP